MAAVVVPRQDRRRNYEGDPPEDTAQDRKRRQLSPVSQQRIHLETLLKNPEQDLGIERSDKESDGPPDIINNILGSSSGAGSGDFHVYKNSRRREFERLRQMQAEVDRESSQAEFEEDYSARSLLDEHKTSKNRKKRAKAKLRKQIKSKPDTK